MKSIYLQKDKTTFDLSQYPAEEFAASMGLPGAPQISFGNQKVKEKKRGGEEIVVPVVEEEVGRDVVASDDDSDVEEDEDEDDEDEDISGSEDGSDLEIGSGSEDEGEDDDEPKVSYQLPHHFSPLETATMMLDNGTDLDEIDPCCHPGRRGRGATPYDTRRCQTTDMWLSYPHRPRLPDSPADIPVQDASGQDKVRSNV